MYKKWFSDYVYVQVWEHRLKAVCLEHKGSFDDYPALAIRKNARREVVEIGRAALNLQQSEIELVNPFSHPRMLLVDFMCAEKLLRYMLRSVYKIGWFTPAPIMIIHPMEKLDGGLTEIEIRAWSELGLSTGVRKAVVYTGPTLELKRELLESL